MVSGHESFAEGRSYPVGMAEAHLAAAPRRGAELGTDGPQPSRGKTEVRLLSELDDLTEAVEVIKGVWGKTGGGLLPVELLRAYAHAGDPVLGAFQVDSGRMIGICVGFLAMPEQGDLHLHSHMTGVTPGIQHRGIGFALKVAQREWCLERGITDVRWTVDPLLAANAWFNIGKLGGTAHSYLPQFYGDMDDDLNRGEQTDRLEMSWAVGSPRVAAILGGQSLNGDSAKAERTVGIPADYYGLRKTDPEEAARQRASVRSQLMEAFDDGLEISGYTRETGYQLTRRV